MSGSPLTSQATSPFVPSDNSVGAVMRTVIYALIPGVVIYMMLFGWGIVINILLACGSALLFEAVMLMLRDRPIRVFLFDGSAVVTAILLALALPPMLSWWIPVLGSVFAIVAAKHLYGGLGYNPFNPAMIGYVVVLIAFPQQMTQWPIPQPGGSFSLLDSLTLQLTGQLADPATLDALTSATPMDQIKTGIGLNRTISEISSGPLFGSIAGQGWELINLLFLAGGLWLYWKKIINWQVPVAVLGALFFWSWMFNMYDGDLYSSPFFHLFSGGTMLCAFFIATDPVTASTTFWGRLIYGMGIGIITFVIRNWGGYPDGIAFAVILMNMAVPTIDYYTQPRVFGHTDA